MNTANEETTAPGKQTTMDLILERVNEVGVDAKLAVAEAREANTASRKTIDLMLQEHEMFKSFDARLRKVERLHIALPIGSAVIAIVSLIAVILQGS